MAMSGVGVTGDPRRTADTARTTSRLYALAPLEYGSAMVESMTGYLMRQAEMFAVPVQVLFRQEIAPLLGRKQLARANHAAAFLRTGAHTFNGRDTLAHDVLEIVARLTGRADLRCSTMLPWGEALAYQALVRLARSWCAVCLEERREQGSPIFEPLAWSLSAVLVCPTHGCPLTTRCPHNDCGKILPMLAPNARPGYCGACARWLGQPPPPTPEQPLHESDDLAWEIWAAQAAGELLAGAAHLTTLPRHDQVAAMVAMYTDTVGGQRSLSERTGIPRETLRRWREGISPPHLRLLLRFCWGVNTTPLRFLTADPGTIVLPQPISPPNPARRQEKAPRRTLDLPSLAASLAEITAATSVPLSVRAVSRRLGIGDTLIRKYFPRQCKEIAERYRVYRREQREERQRISIQEVRRVAQLIDSQGLYPSAVRVIAASKVDLHLAEDEIYEAWRGVIAELGWGLTGERKATPS